MLLLKRWWWKSYNTTWTLWLWLQKKGYIDSGNSFKFKESIWEFWAREYKRRMYVLVQENASWGVNQSSNVPNTGIFIHQIFLNDPVGTFESKWSSFPRRMRIRTVWNHYLDVLMLFLLSLSCYLQEVQVLSTSSPITTDLSINKAARKGGGLFLRHLYSEMMFQPTVKHGGEDSVGGVWLWDNIE